MQDAGLDGDLRVTANGPGGGGAPAPGPQRPLDRTELDAQNRAVVAAAEAERRRIERNLHDGAQQRLVTVALFLHLIRRRLDEAPEVVELVESAQAELTMALEEIRDLVHGLHPRALTEEGLGPALTALAERSFLPVEILELPERRLDEDIEVAVYYVVAEALANAAKHSRATGITVRVGTGGDGTAVEVVDDGVGGADVSAGTGIEGLADRVAALGGTLEVASEPGRGTAVRARLPR